MVELHLNGLSFLDQRARTRSVQQRPDASNVRPLHCFYVIDVIGNRKVAAVLDSAVAEHPESTLPPKGANNHQTTTKQLSSYPLACNAKCSA
ncbi:hypothetical protein [Streptomyces syringium]|uniref:hypothetical protein n=1 Tax=Streptomyces syringium TaxID=76729 RepID=UPI0037D728AF